jgi:outer membrane receptor for ferrienterochelin and colicins
VQLEEFRQIEVVEGPNSALYGFNAVSGVLNIITYDPLRERANAAALRSGTQHYAGGSVVSTGQFGENAAVRISLGGFRARDFAPRALPQRTVTSASLPRSKPSISMAGFRYDLPPHELASRWDHRGY